MAADFSILQVSFMHTLKFVLNTDELIFLCEAIGIRHGWSMFDHSLDRKAAQHQIVYELVWISLGIVFDRRSKKCPSFMQHGNRKKQGWNSCLHLRLERSNTQLGNCFSIDSFTHILALTSFVVLIYHIHVYMYTLVFWYDVLKAHPTSPVAALFVCGLCLLLLVVNYLFDVGESG